MKPELRKILGWVGYPAFYLFSLVFFAYLTFPYDRAKHAIEAGFNTGDSSLRLEIDDLSWSWRFPGVSASGVRLVGKTDAAVDTGEEGGEGQSEGAEKKQPARTEYEIEDMYLRVSVLPLLLGGVDVNFGMDAFGGTINGSAASSDEERSLHIELDDVEPGQLPYLADVVGLPMEGALGGEIDLVLPEGKASQAEGTIDLEIADLAVGDGKAKIRDTIALPRLDAGTLTLRADIKQGRLKLEELSTKGPDLEVVSEGTIRLMDRMDASIDDENMRNRLSEAYKGKNDMTRGLFGEPGSKVPGLFDLDPKTKAAKRPDGFYAWRLTGPVAKLNFAPGAGGGASAEVRGRPPALRATSPRTRKPRPIQRPALPLRRPMPSPPAAMPAAQQPGDDEAEATDEETADEAEQDMEEAEE